MRVTVIGAGILGTALGYRLARAGVHTTIVDADREPSGASWASFAWLNANGKQPASYFELNRAGIRAHAELADELGDGSWHRPVGSIELAPSGDGAEELILRAERQASAGYRSRRLDPAELRDLEPALAVETGRAMTAVLFEDEGWLDTEGLIGLLRKRAADAGAALMLGRAVSSIEPAAVTTTEGERLPFDLLVNAAGASAGQVSALCGGSLPSTSGMLGLTAVTNTVTSAPTRVIRWPGGTARPHPGGGVMVASTASVDTRLPESRVASSDLALAREAVDAASAHVPGLAGATVASVRIARRAVPADSMPVAGPDPRLPWLYHFVTHSGVTLAALLSRLVADEIVNGQAGPALDAYRPGRFAH